MRVMITGGTGFVGFHTAQAYMAAGHEVCLLVRSENKMRDLYGAQSPDFVVGDIMDEASVRQALHNCDCCIHAAAIVSVDPRDAQRVYETNVRGTRMVVECALLQSVSTIIYVSSVSALYHGVAENITVDSPPGSAQAAYARSKIACEVYIRELENRSSSVYSVYPGGIIGPDAPLLNEPHEAIAIFTGPIAPMLGSGGQWIDVRDIAQVLRLIAEKRPRQRRFPLGGNIVQWREFSGIISQFTGNSPVLIQLPGFMMRGIGRLIDFARRFIPIQSPISYEAMLFATCTPIIDDSLTQEVFNFQFRDSRETIEDSLRWLHQAGHISDKRAGKLCAS
jgi:dihydroflavonol-4-reductase